MVEEKNKILIILIIMVLIVGSYFVFDILTEDNISLRESVNNCKQLCPSTCEQFNAVYTTEFTFIHPGLGWNYIRAECNCLNKLTGMTFDIDIKDQCLKEYYGEL